MTTTNAVPARQDAKYLVVFQQITTGNGRAWENHYFPQGDLFPTRAEAIAYGLEERGSDDFNIAVVKGDRLVSFDWMEGPVGEDDETMASIAAALGLAGTTTTSKEPT